MTVTYLKNLFLVLGIGFMPSIFFGQTTSIPDPNFEQELIDHGVDSDGIINGQITTADALGVTYLSLSNDSIADLTGIEVFTDLLRLYCENNQMTTLDLSANLSLNQVWCDNNQLTSLILPSSTALDEVSCEDNQLTNLDLSGCPNLDKLVCSRNPLGSLDLSNNLVLDVLWCTDNQLTSLDFSNNPVLRRLYCRRNQLTSLDVSGNLMLEDFSCSENQITFLDVSNNTLLETFWCEGNLLEQVILGYHAPNFYSGTQGMNGLFAENNMSYLQICGYIPAQIPNIWSKDPSAIYGVNGCFPRALQGSVYQDNIVNCTKDSLEPVYIYSLVRVSNATDTFFFNTDAAGNYHATLDTGTYTVEAFSLNSLWSVCTAPQTITVDTNYVIQELDFGVQVAQSCEFLVVNIGAPFLRMTGGGSNYTVSYCNHGTLPAYSAYVEVELDTSLNVLSTSLPIASQNGNVYTFLLDTIQPLECGSFTISVLVDTSAILGETHCTEAHIYPDSVCGLNWMGPDFELIGTCDSDSAYFTLTNVGTDMGTPIDYYVFEDHLMRQNNNFSLDGGESMNISYPVSLDKTYRFSTDPIPNFPTELGDGFVTLAIEGCLTSPNLIIDTSYVLSMYNGNSDPAIALDCQQNVFAYDPNDKAAQPEGYGTEHYIEKNTPLDYRIRFQNTGNDTAFTVVLKDTLSTHLDLSSLQMGTSSHPYTWNLNNNILTIRFDNIMLPDSNTNEPASNGFVKYTIDQVPNLPLETRIENTAYIYFDYNPAIITNTTFHTIGENFYTIQLINVATHEEQLKTTEYRIFPNPTKDLITIQQDQNLNFSLQLFNLNGQLLKNWTNLNGQYQFDLEDYPSGTYILKIQDEKQVNTYKVVKR